MKLKTENPKNWKRALEAFHESESCRVHDCFNCGGYYDCHHEHGQLWITCSCGASWSVVDAEGGPAIDGFDFEQIDFGCCQ